MAVVIVVVGGGGVTGVKAEVVTEELRFRVLNNIFGEFVPRFLTTPSIPSASIAAFT